MSNDDILLQVNPVIARRVEDPTKQSPGKDEDCFVASAPRHDDDWMRANG
jgi:hypothetical protein